VNAARLEAFSDGVPAIIITIMVLELKVPHGSHLAALKPLLPVVLTCLLSFMYVGIALMWLIPDRRLARVLEESRPAAH
jgi:uncharacterized membrane protein